MSLPLNRIYILILSILVGLACSWIAIRAARKAGLMDIPGSMPHKQHAAPTPLAGGIALLASLLLLSPLLDSWGDRQISSALIATAIVFLFGLLDDRFGFSAPQKLFGQSLAVLFLLLSGVSIRFLESPVFYFGGPFWLYQAGDWLLTALWLIGIANAFNMIDSMDGLAIGLACVALVFLLIGTAINTQSLLNLHLLALLGICIGVLLFNTKPAHLFLGDSGAQSLGFLLALFCILYTPAGDWQASSWFFPVLLLGMPIFDTSLVVFSRLRRGKPFYKSNLDHTYHRLVRIGLTPAQSVLAIHLASILLGSLGFLALQSQALIANLIFLACLLCGGVLIYLLDQPRCLGNPA